MASLVTITAAPAMIAPELSFTDPEMVPVSNWLNSGAMEKQESRRVVENKRDKGGSSRSEKSKVSI